jgi:hypothetical protein
MAATSRQTSLLERINKNMELLSLPITHVFIKYNSNKLSTYRHFVCHMAVNPFPSLVHTTRHTMGVGNEFIVYWELKIVNLKFFHLIEMHHFIF